MPWIVARHVVHLNRCISHEYYPKNSQILPVLNFCPILPLFPLRQYTYIDYTADDWLDKLLYALPLRGLLQNNEVRNDDDVPIGNNIQLQPFSCVNDNVDGRDNGCL